jgi:alpha-galactosidase
MRGRLYFFRTGRIAWHLTITEVYKPSKHRTFFSVDPDLVGITDLVPWEFNRQWLDLVARSGAVSMVSAAPSMRGREQQAALREAFQIAAAGGVGANPVDWMQQSTPETWRPAKGAGSNQERHYHWSGSEGASPSMSA